MELTHAVLVQRAVRWLKNTRKCNVVLAECTAYYLAEFPDAIGWTPRGESLLVECKRTLSDFHADKHKPAQQDGTRVGRYRFYMAPVGVIPVPLIPPRWGFLEVCPRGTDTIVRVRRGATSAPVARDFRDSELMLLLAEFRRGSSAHRANGLQR